MIIHAYLPENKTACGLAPLKGMMLINAMTLSQFKKIEGYQRCTHCLYNLTDGEGKMWSFYGWCLETSKYPDPHKTISDYQRQLDAKRRRKSQKIY